MNDTERTASQNTANGHGVMTTQAVEGSMITLLKRHEIQVLLNAGHTQAEVASLAKVSERSVRRIAAEAAVEHVDDRQERVERRIGRPRKVDRFRPLVEQLLKETDEDRAPLKSVEILRRARLDGYDGGKTALYELVAELRPRHTRVMRFEGLPGEFSQHDFGQVRLRYLDGTQAVVRFFGSRLSGRGGPAVDLVDGEDSETLVRTLGEHLVRFGGVPLCAVFDRPKTVALKWDDRGEVTEWNPVFAYAALELGFTAEVCWGSFFKQRRFHDRDDLVEQLREWLHETNHQRLNRATGEVPEQRRQQELERLRPLRTPPERLALRIPIQVDVTGEVSHDGLRYSMPPQAAGMAGTLYLYRDVVHIVAGRYEAEHPRHVANGTVSRLAEHRTAHLAAISGARGRRYLKRQQLLETGAAALSFLTELIHRSPRSWYRKVDILHELLQYCGAKNLDRALQAAVSAQNYTCSFIAECLGVKLPLRPDAGEHRGGGS